MQYAPKGRTARLAITGLSAVVLVGIGPPPVWRARRRRAKLPLAG